MTKQTKSDQINPSLKKTGGVDHGAGDVSVDNSVDVTNKTSAKTTSETQDEAAPSVHLRWFDWPAMGILTVLMLVVFAQFITRYIFNDSWAWTEEVSRYLLMALVFTGCISVVARSEHIRLEVVRQRVSAENQSVMLRFADIVSLVFYLFLAIGLLLLASETSQNLVSVSFPKAAVYAALGVSLLGVCIIKLRKLRSTDGGEA